MNKSNNKLNQLLDTFSSKEIDEFGKFISSPFITKGRNYLPILNYILKLNNNSKGKKKNEDQDTGEESLNLSKQTLRNRYSELYKLGEEFLIYKWLNKNKLDRDKLLLKSLENKNLLTHFKSAYSNSLNQLDLKKFNLKKLKSFTEFYEINSDYLLELNKEDILYKEYYEKSLSNLGYYLLSLFENGIEFFQQENVNIKFDPNYVTEYLKRHDIEDLISEFRHSGKLMFRIVAMYYYLYKAFEDLDKENNYFTAHKIFSENSKDLEENYKVYIFIYLINYCISKFNTGDLKYRLELFKLYNEKLDQGLIADLKYNSYSFNHFRDYVLIGLELKKYKWVEDFINKYSVYLPTNLKENEIRISLAKLKFAKKEYKDSLAHLIDLKPTHYLLYIDSSMYKLYNYYELKEFEESYPIINNFKQYFRNNKEIPKVHRIRNLNFIKIYLKLLKFISEPIKTDPGLIEKEFQKIDQISGKTWLAEKIAELNK